MRPEQAKALPLGAKCTYSARLAREGVAAYRQSSRKEWRRADLGIAVPCVYIGWRTLSDGINDYEPDEGYVYVADRHFDAALVVYDPRCKPVVVPFDALEAV